MPDLGHIKGVAFGELVRWYGEAHGADELRCIAAAVGESFPGVFATDRPNLGILSSRWYPGPVIHALLDELSRGRSDDELDAMALAAAEVIMQRTIRGIYRTMFRLVATPERYVKHIQKVWSLYYDNGAPSVDVEGPTRHRIRYVGWRSHHPLACRLNAFAGLPIYREMGCQGVEVRRAGCVSSGAEACEVIISWR